MKKRKEWLLLLVPVIVVVLVITAWHTGAGAGRSAGPDGQSGEPREEFVRKGPDYWIPLAP